MEKQQPSNSTSVDSLSCTADKVASDNLGVNINPNQDDCPQHQSVPDPIHSDISDGKCISRHHGPSITSKGNNSTTIMSTDNAQTESFSEVLPQNMDHLGISSNSDAVPKNDATAASVNHSVQDIANTSESMFAHPPLVPEYVHSGSVQIPSSVVLKVCPSDSDDEYATVSDEVSHTQTPDNTQETDTDKDLTTPDGNKAPFAEIPSPTFSEQYGSFTPSKRPIYSKLTNKNDFHMFYALQ
jgi:hypothetical protein